MKDGCSVKSNLTVVEDDRFSNLLSDLFLHPNFTSLVSISRLVITAHLTRNILLHSLNGEFIDAGVYMGGSTAVLMNILNKFEPCGRKVWAFDSFQGLPEPSDMDFDEDFSIFATKGLFASPQTRFESQLRALNVWNENIIRVQKGWFNETMPVAPIKSIAFLRIDADIYSSTMEVLNFLYAKVVPGGYVLVDDYGSFAGCRRAVDIFRTRYRIYEPLRFVKEDNTSGSIRFEAVWWKKRLSRKRGASKGSPS